VISSRERVVAAVALLAAFLWQVYVVTQAVRQASIFLPLFAGLGSPLPSTTTFFVSTYEHWWFLPAVFALLSLDVIRRPQPSLLYLAAVLGGALGTALVLNAWLQQALMAPMIQIIRQIG